MVVVTIIIQNRNVSDEYIESMQIFGKERALTVYNDWLKMNLKEGLKEDVDYILLPYNAWKQFTIWYLGGPEIRIPLIGSKENGKTIGEPDVNPVTLTYKFVSGSNTKINTRGFLISLLSTCEHVWSYIGEIIKRNTGTFLLKHYGKIPGSIIVVGKNDYTLAEKGLAPYDLLMADDISLNYGSEKNYHPEKEYGQQQSTRYADHEPMTGIGPLMSAKSDFATTEEDMINQAIANSLKEAGDQTEEPKQFGIIIVAADFLLTLYVSFFYFLDSFTDQL